MELFKINFLILFFISSFFTIANAGEGPAFAYKIKMHKIEICDSTSTATACNGAVTIWDGGAAGSAYINIADTNAGATAASMGNIMLAEIGVEYTYFQITLLLLTYFLKINTLSIISLYFPHVYQIQ